MIESTALATMDEIQDFCREVNLPCSEKLILKMHKEEGFPLMKLGEQWESDKDIIQSWRRNRLQKNNCFDMTYIEERNQFITPATKYANEVCGKTAPKSSDPEIGEKWAADWNYTYHTEINRLWREYDQKKRFAAEFAQNEARRIYKEKLADMMGRRKDE
jgi:hypothetical protein